MIDKLKYLKEDADRPDTSVQLFSLAPENSTGENLESCICLYFYEIGFQYKLELIDD